MSRRPGADRPAARALHAAELRRLRPDISTVDLRTAWQHLSDAERDGYLTAARAAGADYDEAAVLAQVVERRRLNGERIAEQGIDMTPAGIRKSGAALLRDRLNAQRTRRAEAAGRLDLDGH